MTRRLLLKKDLIKLFATWYALKVEVAQPVGWSEVLVVDDVGHDKDNQQCDQENQRCDGDGPLHQIAVFTLSWGHQSWGGEGEEKSQCKLCVRTKVEEVADGKDNYEAKGN